MSTKGVGTQSDQQQSEEFMIRYKENVKKLRALSRVAVHQFLGTRREDDPHVLYLTDRDTLENLATVQLEVLTGFVTKKLGITKQEYLKAHGDQLLQQIKTMESDLCVTGWDDKGNPIFNLAAYRERTKGWPA